MDTHEKNLSEILAQEERSEPTARSNVIQDGAERKSISNPALLIPSRPAGREGTIESEQFTERGGHRVEVKRWFGKKNTSEKASV